MFGVEPGEQWDQPAEKYELLRRPGGSVGAAPAERRTGIPAPG
jgi:hypothetical protein